MADIGSLVIRIAADAGSLEKAFHNLGGEAKQFQRGLDQISKTMQTAFFAATTAAVAMTIQAGKTAEETEQLAQKSGIAAVALEGMSVSMARFGLNSSNITTAIKGLSTVMVGVQQGTASAIATFSQLGLSMDVVGRGTGATLKAIADRFKDIPDGALKAKLATDIFGRSGLDLIPMLNKGAAAIDEAMKKSAEFGLILSETARGQLTVFDDAMDDLQSALKGFAMQVGIAFAPSLTILVKAFTDLIVFTKDVFNQFSDAASRLSIRLAAMVASIQILSSNLFSMKAFSKAAWEETMNHVKAIDAWASAEMEGVHSAREAQKELDVLAQNHLGVSQSVEAHANSQQRLGQQIVANAKIQMAQAEALGKQQERMGADIVSGAKVTMSVDLNEGKRQEALGRRIQEEFEVSQRIAQDWVDAYMIEETAYLARADAEDAARAKNEEAQGRFIVTQATQALQLKGFWERQLDSLVASNAFSVGLIVNAWTSGVANAIVNGGDFVKAAWQATQVAIIQGSLNALVQEGAILAKKVLLNQAAAAATAGTWAGAGAVITGVFATVTASFAAMFATLVSIVTAVGTFIMGVLSAIASALTATVFGIPWAGAILLGIGLIAAALAATGNLGFKEGGIGDFGSGTQATLHGPEAIIPLNSRGANFMREVFGEGEGSQRPIIVKTYLDGRQIAIATSDKQDSAWRRMGLPA